MRFAPTPIPGAFVVEFEPAHDERGSFARVFDEVAFREHGLATSYPQVSFSQNPRAGTLRGMHFQLPPHEECKLVRCTRGRAFEVFIDLRANSPAHRRWFSVEIAPRGPSTYVPAGVAHGFQTLEDETDIEYMISVPYAPEAAAGVRWDDPAFGVAWPPVDQRIISERDRGHPGYLD